MEGNKEKETIISSTEVERNDFNIDIPRVLLGYLGKYDYTIDDLVMVYLLHTNRKKHIVFYLAGRNDLQKTVLFSKFERKFLVEKLIKSEEFDLDNYKLTQTGIDLLNNCRNYFSTISEIVDVMNSPMTNGDFEELVQNFIEIFPEKTRNGGNEVLRSNKLDVSKKMRQFISKYDFSKEVILGATRKYINIQSRTRYQYCSGAHYFIMKDGNSKLANECQAYLEGDKDEGDEFSSFTEQVM